MIRWNWVMIAYWNTNINCLIDQIDYYKTNINYKIGFIIDDSIKIIWHSCDVDYSNEISIAENNISFDEVVLSIEKIKYQLAKRLCTIAMTIVWLHKQNTCYNKYDINYYDNNLECIMKISITAIMVWMMKNVILLTITIISITIWKCE